MTDHPPIAAEPAKFTRTDPDIVVRLARIEGKLDELLARPAIALTGIKVMAMPASEKQTIIAEWSEG